MVNKSDKDISGNYPVAVERTFFSSAQGQVLG